MRNLKNKRVAVFGVGGVGGYAVDALARNGVGTIDIFDNDTVALTNLNRQIIALHSTIGRAKVDVMGEYIARIAPEIVVNHHRCFYMPDNADEYDFSVYDYIIDAIDTVKGKLEIVTRAKALSVPVISCMGTGNKLDAVAIEVADIYETSVCPLAKTMRRELRRRGIGSLRVVYSKEIPIKPISSRDTDAELIGTSRRATPGSTAFVPAVAGLTAADEVIKDLVNIKTAFNL